LKSEIEPAIYNKEQEVVKNGKKMQIALAVMELDSAFFTVVRFYQKRGKLVC